MAAGPIQHALDRQARRGPTGARTGDLEEPAPEGIYPTGGQDRILILFSDTGGGHRAAASALDRALRQLQPDVAITWCDPLIGQGRLIARRLSSLYPTITRRAPLAWDTIFYSSNTQPAFAAIRRALRPQLRPILERQIAATQPNVVLSVHPLCNHITVEVLRRGSCPRALMTVITDLIDIHRGWACRDADIVVVPTVEAEGAVLRAGVPGERVRFLGMPVDSEFRPARPGERAVLRRRLGLDEDRPTVLVTGGGEGAGGLLQQVRQLSCGPEPASWQVIVVCGRNERLRRTLLGWQFSTPTLVLGFVDNMPELMRASNVAVGKAGPGAIAEALAAGLPIVLTSHLPGQERGNVRFVLEWGIGCYTPQTEQLRAAVTEVLGSVASYEPMLARARSVARPDAVMDIATTCLELAAGYRAASHASR